MTRSAAKRANRNARVDGVYSGVSAHDERFERWLNGRLAEWLKGDRRKALNSPSRMESFAAGIESERARALDVIRRVEALPVEIQTNHPGAPPPHFTRKLVSLAAVMDILEELRG